MPTPMHRNHWASRDNYKEEQQLSISSHSFFYINFTMISLCKIIVQQSLFCSIRKNIDLSISTARPRTWKAAVIYWNIKFDKVSITKKKNLVIIAKSGLNLPCLIYSIKAKNCSSQQQSIGKDPSNVLKHWAKLPSKQNLKPVEIENSHVILDYLLIY